MIITILASTWIVILAAGAVGAQPGHPIRHGSMPAVSRDGRWVAFASERDGTWDLYRIGADGQGLRRLTRTAEEELVPQWTRDGSLVAMFASDESTRLGAIGTDGAVRTLTTGLRKGSALSNNGRRIAYALGSWQRNRLYVADLDGSHARALTDSTAGWFNMAWSPDDRTIAVTRRDATGDLQVWLIDVDDVGRRALTHFAQRDGRPQWPAWSSDGTKIAIQAGLYDRDHPERSDAYIWVIDVASGRATRLGSHDRPWLDETPSWFPDGKRIACQSTRTGRFEIWVMDADGTDARPITR